MLHQPITHPNSPSKQPAYEGEIDCSATCEEWCGIMWDAQRLQGLLIRAKAMAAKLEADASANGILTEAGMADEIDAAMHDMGLDALVSRIDEETAKYLDR
jgi:hypothetical protein